MIVHVCDYCGEIIPVVKKKIFGVEVDCLEVGFVKSEQFPWLNNFFRQKDFHKQCAKTFSLELDYEMIKSRKRILNENKP